MKPYPIFYLWMVHIAWCLFLIVTTPFWVCLSLRKPFGGPREWFSFLAEELAEYPQRKGSQ